MTDFKNSIYAGLGFTFLFGLFLWFCYDLNYALIVGPISGVAFGTALYIFVTSKIVARQTEIKKTNGQEIIYSAKANHFINEEAAGGKLYLLDDRLEFKSHGFNIQNHSLKIPLSNIQEIGFYNVLGLMPTGLSITLTNGKVEKFVIGKRRLWRDKISKLKNWA